jgi:hypothetical protein
MLEGDSQIANGGFTFEVVIGLTSGRRTGMGRFGTIVLLIPYFVFRFLKLP